MLRAKSSMGLRNEELGERNSIRSNHKVYLYCTFQQRGSSKCFTSHNHQTVTNCETSNKRYISSNGIIKVISTQTTSWRCRSDGIWGPCILSLFQLVLCFASLLLHHSLTSLLLLYGCWPWPNPCSVMSCSGFIHWITASYFRKIIEYWLIDCFTHLPTLEKLRIYLGTIHKFRTDLVKNKSLLGMYGNMLDIQQLVPAFCTIRLQWWT